LANGYNNEKIIVQAKWRVISTLPTLKFVMDFEEMGLNSELLLAIKELGYSNPTPIQEKCIPLIIEGNDVVGQSLTGSGKTATFALPILNDIFLGMKAQVLVLTPTRELAQQIKEHFDELGKYTQIKTACIFGGVEYDSQVRGLKESEVIISTPGRLLDHIKGRTIKLNNVRKVVIDEADKMLNLGFGGDVNRILEMTPKKRQTLMFSATMSEQSKKLAERYLKKPIFVKEKLHVDAELLKQIFYFILEEKKFSLLVHLLKQNKGTSLVFCKSRKEVEKVNLNLKRQRINCMMVHGDLSQEKRMLAVEKFKEGQIQTLIVTDVASRGLDIKNVSFVYNYSVPKDPEVYTHRIGRSARAGASGEAITFVTQMDGREFEAIPKRKNIIQQELPAFREIETVECEALLGKKRYDEEHVSFKRPWEKK